MAGLSGRIQAPSTLRAFLRHLIDYAGMFPPASLSPDTAAHNYERYRTGEHAWILGRLIVPLDQIDGAPTDAPLSILSNADHVRAAAIESKRVINTGKATYCEVPVEQLEAVKRTGSFAKIRTGGITPASIPSVDTVSAFIEKCADLHLPFKATAGLHHAIRGVHPLSYEPGAPRAAMHGFLNVFLAAAFACHGERNVDAILAEEDPDAFRFTENDVHWRDRSLNTQQLDTARQFAHSFGSCSFEEPVNDLISLGLL